MKDRNKPQPGPSKLNEQIRRDLDALSTRSRRDTPSLQRTIHSLSDRKPERSWEERLMAWTGFLRNHPKYATLTVTAVLAAALLVVPISYNKVVGHEVTVSLDGRKVSDELIHGLAGELKDALGAEAVVVDVGMEDGQRVYTLSAVAPENDAPAVSRAFARTLTARGITAEATSTPVKERVSGNVYAMAYANTFGSAIQVDIDGKSAEEIEAEILAQLEAAGFDAEVSVTMADDHMKIEVTAESEGPMGEGEDCAQIVLTSDGEPLLGTMENHGVKMTKTVDDSGEQLSVEVVHDGRTLVATVDDPGSLSDQELAEVVHKQLFDQGLDISVSAQNGRIHLMKMDASRPGDRQIKDTSWGRLKSEGVDDN